MNRKAADQGHAIAQHNLGSIYYWGNGVPKDAEEAVKWYRKAADQGNASAQFNLGVVYFNGEGVPKDKVMSYKWFNLSAAQGNAESKAALERLEQTMNSDQIAEAQRLTRAFVKNEKTGSGTDTPQIPPKTDPSASGTGFFITPDGFLMTNAHVVEGGSRFRLVTVSGTVDATLVQVDAANDLALLKAKGMFTALPVASSRGMRLGSTVATVGFPNIGLQGFAPKLAKGEIAAMSGIQDDARFFQISLPVQPGNSGGPLVDERGNVVGIVSAKLSAKAALEASGSLPENVNYAVKSSFVLGFLESVPNTAAGLKDPNTAATSFEDVVSTTRQATVLVLVY